MVGNVGLHRPPGGQRGVDHFVASVAPDNELSLVIVRNLGFMRTGQYIDPEDGPEYVFEL